MPLNQRDRAPRRTIQSSQYYQGWPFFILGSAGKEATRRSKNQETPSKKRTKKPIFPGRSMATSSSANTPMKDVLPVDSAKGKSPVDVPPVDLATPTEVEKSKKIKKKMKKVRMPQYHMNRIMTVEKWEPLPPIDEEFLKNLSALIPNGEQYFADRGFTVERYRELDNMDFVEKAQKDMIAEIQEDYKKNGYVEMMVTDDEEEMTAPAGKGRRRFRPGVAKKTGGGVNKSI